ncbi:MAG: tetratricopeptide repeat protein [Bacteroidetes bacterium]|nr:tetratricopeptide repeat protein [Bacteroidota bacterium]
MNILAFSMPKNGMLNNRDANVQMQRYNLRHLLLLALFCNVLSLSLASGQVLLYDPVHPDGLLMKAIQIAESDTADGLVIARQVLHEARAAHDTHLEAYACLVIGSVHAKTRIKSLALPWLEKALALFEDQEDEVGMAISYREMGVLLARAKKRDLPGAEQYSRKSLAIFERYREENRIAHNLLGLANILMVQGKNPEAISLFRRSIEVSGRLRIFSCQATSYINLGHLYQKIGLLDSAVHCCKEVIPLLQRTGDFKNISLAYSNLASLYSQLGRIDDSERCLIESYKAAKSSGDEEKMAICLVDWATNLFAAARYAEAETRYKECLSLLDLLSVYNRQAQYIKATCYRMLGKCEMVRHRYKGALDNLRRAAKILDAGDELTASALIERDIGMAYLELDNLERARSSTIRSLVEFRLRKEITEVAPTLLQLARILRKQDSMRSATQAIVEALALSKQIKLPSVEAEANTLMARIHMDGGQTAEAEKLLRDAVTTFHELHEPYALTQALLLLSECLLRQNKTREAKPFLNTAEWLSDSLGIGANTLTILKTRAEIAGNEGNIDSAHFLLKKYLIMYDSLENHRQSARFESLLFEFDTERKDFEITRLKSQQELHRVEMERQQEVLRRKRLEEVQRKQVLELLTQKYQLQDLDLQLTTTELEGQKTASREREQRLVLAKKENALQLEILDRETLFRNAAITGFVLLALIFFLIVRSLRLKKRESEAMAAIAGLEAKAAKSESHRIRAEIAEHEEAAQRVFARQLIHAQEEERQRIASDLHDSLAQKLVVIQNRATLALQNPEDPEYIKQQLERISSTATDTVGEVRTISHALRPQLLSRFGLSSALRNLIEDVNSCSDINWEAKVDDLAGLLTPDDEINLYRIVQEAVSNVIRHSDAPSALLEVQRTASSLQITLSDDGRGFDQSTVKNNGNGGLGLGSMHQRAELLSSELSINSQTGSGTRIVLTVPIPPGQSQVETPTVSDATSQMSEVERDQHS